MVNAGAVVSLGVIVAIMGGGVWVMHSLFGIVGAALLALFLLPVLYLVVGQLDTGDSTTQHESKGARGGRE